MAAMLVNRSGQNEEYLERTFHIDASYQVSVHLARCFERRRFNKIGISETRIAYGGKSLLMDRDKMSNL
jgi:hypothetical protein